LGLLHQRGREPASRLCRRLSPAAVLSRGRGGFGPAYNLTTSNHPKGNGNGYILSLGGKLLYVSGDTEDTPELRALRNIDVAFLAMNVPYTMTVAKAVSAVREFRPKVVYPYHYRNADGSFADLEAFKRQVGTDLGIEVRLRKWY
jgi:L-ascorbate metabolism protein UlaG (beta-lactamase superfamily)